MKNKAINLVILAATMGASMPIQNSALTMAAQCGHPATFNTN